MTACGWLCTVHPLLGTVTWARLALLPEAFNLYSGKGSGEQGSGPAVGSGLLQGWGGMHYHPLLGCFPCLHGPLMI